MAKLLVLEAGFNPTDEEIADAIIQRLKREKLYSINNMYSGLRTTDKIVELIQKNGTDRTPKKHEQMARKLMEERDETEEPISYSQALFETRPDHIWVNPQSFLIQSINIVRERKIGKPTMLVYKGSSFEGPGKARGISPTTLSVMHGMGYHKFSTSPLQALKAIVLFDER